MKRCGGCAPAARRSADMPDLPRRKPLLPLRVRL
jgi:hypothetical protein